MQKLPLASIITGVLFILVGLVVVIIMGNLSPQAFWIIRVMVALGTGFIAAGILGPIDFKGTVKNWTIKAGGPIALTLVIYLLNPPNLVS